MVHNGFAKFRRQFQGVVLSTRQVSRINSYFMQAHLFGLLVFLN